MFSYIDLEKPISAAHPPRVIREIANPALKSLSRDVAALYSPIGRESIAPERRLRGLLLQAFYSIRSERQLSSGSTPTSCFAGWLGSASRHRCEEFGRDLAIPEPVTVFGEGGGAPHPIPKEGSGDPSGPGRNGEPEFRGERRQNVTHASTPDPAARLFRKGPGKEAPLSFLGQALMEHRNGLIIDAVGTRALGPRRAAGGDRAGRAARRPAKPDYAWDRQSP